MEMLRSDESVNPSFGTYRVAEPEQIHKRRENVILVERAFSSPVTAHGASHAVLCGEVVLFWGV